MDWDDDLRNRPRSKARFGTGAGRIHKGHLTAEEIDGVPRFRTTWRPKDGEQQNAHAVLIRIKLWPARDATRLLAYWPLKRPRFGSTSILEKL
jgi:hypothetical protein